MAIRAPDGANKRKVGVAGLRQIPRWAVHLYIYIYNLPNSMQLVSLYKGFYKCPI